MKNFLIVFAILFGVGMNCEVGWGDPRGPHIRGPLDGSGRTQPAPEVKNKEPENEKENEQSPMEKLFGALQQEETDPRRADEEFQRVLVAPWVRDQVVAELDNLQRSDPQQAARYRELIQPKLEAEMKALRGGRGQQYEVDRLLALQAKIQMTERR